jgi:hypothetical protein
MYDCIKSTFNHWHKTEAIEKEFDDEIEEKKFTKTINDIGTKEYKSKKC